MAFIILAASIGSRAKSTSAIFSTLRCQTKEPKLRPHNATMPNVDHGGGSAYILYIYIYIYICTSHAFPLATRLDGFLTPSCCPAARAVGSRSWAPSERRSVRQTPLAVWPPEPKSGQRRQLEHGCRLIELIGLMPTNNWENDGATGPRNAVTSKYQGFNRSVFHGKYLIF